MDVGTAFKSRKICGVLVAQVQNKIRKFGEKRATNCLKDRYGSLLTAIGNTNMGTKKATRRGGKPVAIKKTTGAFRTARDAQQAFRESRSPTCERLDRRNPVGFEVMNIPL